jgi:pimeloyl-ACP methyl ester carboxylesterase
MNAETPMKIIPNQEVQIATESRGTPSQGTILLAMGSTASMHWWPQTFVTQLAAAGYEVVRFDHRDTGRSTTNSPGDVRYDLGELVTDLVAILDSYGVDAAHLVGMSLGAYVAQIASLSYPSRIRSLTLIAAEPLGQDYEASGIAPEFTMHFAKMSDLDLSDRNSVAGFMLEIARLSAGSAVPFDPAAAMARIELELDHAQNIQSAFNHSMIEGKIDHGLTAASIRQPTLIIHGTEDPIISVNAARCAASVIPGSKLLLLDRRGHELLAHDLNEIATAIIDHCDSASRMEDRLS